MIFRNRFHAGEKLAEKLKGFSPRSILVAIPRGGVAIAYSVSIKLGIKMTVVGVRKLPVPWSPEAGFGAVAEDGTIYINEALVRRFWIENEEISRIAEDVLSEVRRRVRIYRGDRLPDFSGKEIIVVDDGFATGYTAIAACELVKRAGAVEVILSAPCAPENTVKLLSDYGDDVITLITEKFTPFAVANYYEDFHDMTDDEVLEILEALKERGLIYKE